MKKIILMLLPAVFLASCMSDADRNANEGAHDAYTRGEEPDETEPVTEAGEISIFYGETPVWQLETRYIYAHYFDSSCPNPEIVYEIAHQSYETEAIDTSEGFNYTFSLGGRYYVTATVLNAPGRPSKTIGIDVIGEVGTCEITIECGDNHFGIGETKYIWASYDDPSVPRPLFHYEIRSKQDYFHTDVPVSDGISYTFRFPEDYTIKATVTNHPDRPSKTIKLITTESEFIYARLANSFKSSDRSSTYWSNELEFFYDARFLCPIRIMPFDMTLGMLYLHEKEYPTYPNNSYATDYTREEQVFDIICGSTGPYALTDSYSRVSGDSTYRGSYYAFPWIWQLTAGDNYLEIATPE